MNAKTLGWIQIVGAVLAVIFARELFTTWAGAPLAVGILAVVIFVMGLHHLAEKKRR